MGRLLLPYDFSPEPRTAIDQLPRRKLLRLVRHIRLELPMESVNGHPPILEWWRDCQGQAAYIADPQGLSPPLDKPLQRRDTAYLDQLIAPVERAAFKEWISTLSQDNQSFHSCRARSAPAGPYQPVLFWSAPLGCQAGHFRGHWISLFRLRASQPVGQQEGESQPNLQQSAFQQPALQQSAFQLSAFQQPALQQPDRVLTGFFESIPVGVLMLSADGKIVFINEILRRSLQVCGNASREASLQDIFPGETVVFIRDWLSQQASASPVAPAETGPEGAGSPGSGTVPQAQPALLYPARDSEPIPAIIAPFLIHNPQPPHIPAVMVRPAAPDQEPACHQEALVAQLHSLYENLGEFFRMYTSRLSWHKPFDPADYGLTSKETEAVTLLMKGCSNRDIARKMDIADVTVRKHLTNIYRKAGVSNRYELILLLTGSPPKKGESP